MRDVYSERELCWLVDGESDKLNDDSTHGHGQR